MTAFWGPRMNELLRELDRRGVRYGHMSPAIFADMMDEMTGTKHAVGGDPEACAVAWLEALRNADH